MMADWWCLSPSERNAPSIIPPPPHDDDRTRLQAELQEARAEIASLKTAMATQTRVMLSEAKQQAEAFAVEKPSSELNPSGKGSPKRKEPKSQKQEKGAAGMGQGKTWSGREIGSRWTGTFSGEAIGSLQTCFVEKNGTPRQGCVCPSSAAELKVVLPGLNASHALEGLENFSHVWLLWIFHDNGNVATKSKIHPPRLDGAKVGLFSTRTPHRPNNIGLSLVELRGAICLAFLHGLLAGFNSPLTHTCSDAVVVGRCSR